METPASAVPWTDIVGAISDLLVAIVAVVAAIVAAIGLNQWRTELLGAARHDSARKLYLSAHRWLAAYHWVRHPVTFAGEYPDVPNGPENDPRDSDLNEQRARYRRLEELGAAALAVREAAWEAQTDLGDDLQPLVERVLSLSAKVTADVQVYFLALRQSGSPNHRAAGIVDKTLELAYGTENDAIGSAATQAVAELESYLSAYLGRGTAKVRRHGRRR